jgi:hypothetical protein
MHGYPGRRKEEAELIERGQESCPALFSLVGPGTAVPPVKAVKIKITPSPYGVWLLQSNVIIPVCR